MFSTPSQRTDIFTLYNLCLVVNYQLLEFAGPRLSKKAVVKGVRKVKKNVYVFIDGVPLPAYDSVADVFLRRLDGSIGERNKIPVSSV